MRIFLIIVVNIVFLLNISLVSAANIMDTPRVAVMQFGNKAITSSGMNRHTFDLASEYAIYQLSASGWFDLIDYEQLSAIAKMHNINNSGLVDSSTAVQMGKFAGAQFMVVGNVTGLTTKVSGGSYQHGDKANIGVNNRTVIANVAMRIVDIETGRIVVAGLGKGESSSANVEIAFKKYRNKNNSMTSVSTSTIDNTVTNSGETLILDENNSNVIDNNMNTIINDSNMELDTGNTDINLLDTEEGVGAYDAAGNEYEEYKIRIGSDDFSDVQVVNAIGKAVRDAIYGKMGLLTTLNGGKQLKIKTGFAF